MRAFRPSSYAPVDECEEELEPLRLENVLRYAKRAEAGLPLFESLPVLDEAGQ